MNDYTVTWTIEVSADSAETAARVARAMQLDPNSTATVFVVNGPNGSVEVDTDKGGDLTNLGQDRALLATVDKPLRKKGTPMHRHRKHHDTPAQCCAGGTRWYQVCACGARRERHSCRQCNEQGFDAAWYMPICGACERRHPEDTSCPAS